MSAHLPNANDDRLRDMYDRMCCAESVNSPDYEDWDMDPTGDEEECPHGVPFCEECETCEEEEEESDE